MGRHSAPDDQPDDAAVATLAEQAPDAAAEAERRGRHAAAAVPDERATSVIAPVAPDVHPEAHTDTLPAVDDAAPAAEAGTSAPAADASAEAAPAPVRRESGTRADLRLLRERPALRARCIAGVLAPFLVYTIVLVVLGMTGIYLLWVWAPTVTAGVLVGAFLDLAHRRNLSS